MSITASAGRIEAAGVRSRPPQTRRVSTVRRSDVVDLLTPREREVFALLGEGITAVAIAHRLGVSPRTVEKHLENLYARVGVHDRLSAVLLLYNAAKPASM